MTTHLTYTQKQTIRIALAKWAGFTNVEFYEDNAGPGMWVGDPPKDRPLHLGRPDRHIPNYPASLEACREIEVKLTDDEHRKFRMFLCEAVNGHRGATITTEEYRKEFSASAEHRSLALFRALNLGELGD